MEAVNFPWMTKTNLSLIIAVYRKFTKSTWHFPTANPFKFNPLRQRYQLIGFKTNKEHVFSDEYCMFQSLFIDTLLFALVCLFGFIYNNPLQKAHDGSFVTVIFLSCLFKCICLFYSFSSQTFLEGQDGVYADCQLPISCISHIVSHHLPNPTPYDRHNKN